MLGRLIMQKDILRDLKWKVLSIGTRRLMTPVSV